jgi:hypothetical protein
VRHGTAFALATAMLKKMTALPTAAAFLLLACAPAVQAADGDAASTDTPHIEIAASPRVVMLPPAGFGDQLQLKELKPTRPASLPVLYATLAGLEAYDGYSTLRGVSSGANETNPLVGGLARQPAVFWTIKAVTTGASILFAEQLWRQNHRTQAVVLMILTNGAMGVIAARNASVLSQR